MKKDSKEFKILDDFLATMVRNTKPLDPEISDYIDKHLFEMV